MDLNGTSAGMSHDQFAVTGHLDLSGAPTLNLTVGYVPLLNDSYTIVTATDSITGTFNGLANGDRVRAGGMLFQIHYTTNAITLTRVRQQVTVTATGSQTYGGSNQIFTPSYAGLMPGDDASVVSGTPIFSTDAVSRSPVGGSYTASVDVSGLSATNYTFVAGAPGNFLVNPAPLTVTANGVNKVYDGTRTAVVTLTDNRLVGDELTVSYTNALFDTRNVGSGKTVTVSGLSLAGADVGNYTLSADSVNTTANITQRAITVTADPQTKTYGDADPGLTFQITAGSLAMDDVMTGSLTRDPGSDVGQYAIRQDTLTAGGNYTLTYVGANLTITPRPLTITADSTSKVTGAALPTFTATYNGLVNGDGPAVVSGLVLSTTATAFSPVGTYAITASGGTAANYDITHIDGTLTVLALPLQPPSQSPSQVNHSAPAVPSQPVRVALVQLGRGKKAKLAAQVTFSGGLPSRDVMSPYQKPRMQSVSVELVVNSDGSTGLLFWARRGKRWVSRLVLL